MKTKLSSAFTFVELMIIIVIICILASMAIPAFKYLRGAGARVEVDPTYQAWCKLQQRYDISYAEWTTLRKAGFLDNYPDPATRQPNR